ncbi:MAG: hypothetical protein M3Y87_06430 [Myxococcota bacterium]|nr:hypothetical protein [Myxococcota bacterium]
MHEITSDAVEVPAGTELDVCHFAPSPVEGDAALTRIRITPSAASHHVSLEYVLASGEHPPVPGSRRCDGMSGLLLVGAQGGPADYVFPAGAAMLLPAGAWLIVHDHVLASAGPATSAVTVSLDVAEPSGVDRWINALVNAVDEESISVGHRTRVDVTARCALTHDVEIVRLWSHMHALGTSFVIRAIDADGSASELYASTDWAHPTTLDLSGSPLLLRAGSALEWTCTYENRGDTTVVGGGRATDEMCVVAAFLLADEAAPPEVCIAPAS